MSPHRGVLANRYRPEDLAVFSADERRRFLDPIDRDILTRAREDPEAWEAVVRLVAWELLYRLEPELYGRLIAGERLHPGILSWLPEAIPRAVEVGAGLGRLTVDLAPRCTSLFAVEPALPLRTLLEHRLHSLAHDDLRVGAGFLDELPLPDRWADLTVTCSVFSCDVAHGGDEGLAELERVTAIGGLVVIILPPSDRAWLERRGFEFVDFDGEMFVEFPSVEEALEIASIFYPWAVDRVAELGQRTVPYEVLGMAAPRTLAWRRVQG